jgi:signal peptidase I
MKSDEYSIKVPWYRRKLVMIPLVVGLLVISMIIVAAVLFLRPLNHEGTSMLPTIGKGDRIITSKIVGKIERGDIVVFYYPKDTSQSLVNRVIGLPGETIDMDEKGNITINGMVLEEPYIEADRNETARSRWYRISTEWKHLEADYYFLMGDNRNVSNDSRTWGPVAKELIHGKYIGRY